VELMGSAVAEMLPRGVPAEMVTRVQKELIGTMRNHAVPAKMRVRCGDVLARVGDPRFRPETEWCLPDDEMLGFVSHSRGGLPNHPVAEADLWEALAYCAWLTETLKTWPFVSYARTNQRLGVLGLHGDKPCRCRRHG
jgi:hypothetical protein